MAAAGANLQEEESATADAEELRRLKRRAIRKVMFAS